VTGRVVLIGAGPGDPELITLKGARALGEVDVVVYDRLASPSLLAHCRPDAERVYVGKEPGRDHLSQERINALLIDGARRGLIVARLKGGDPFVFGRGGEEVLACAAAGVPCEVIPGVTSAVAAAAVAGIPLTHRAVARSFAVVTASTAAEAEAVDVARLAGSVDTLVFLMAAGKLEALCDTLIAAGRHADEPAAAIQWATTSDERLVIAALRDLPEAARAARIGPPATLIVGAVAAIPAEAAALATHVSTQPSTM
jgi:uroporphyrinogen III methyltransferase/synthase